MTNKDDLISRKVLKQAIYTDFCEHFTQCHDSDQRALIDMVMNDIDEIPAAFDKEKVIEELNGEIELCVTHPLYPGRYIKKSRTIKIVEKGGIE